MLKKATDLENLLLVSEGGIPGGGFLPHVGYGLGAYKLHKFFMKRQKEKLMDQLYRKVFNDNDVLKKLLK